MGTPNIDDYFFCSYAREDQEKKDHIQEFFNDLCEEIRGQTGLRSHNPIGFFDQKNIELGQEWPVRLVNALCRNRSIVCLYSPRYFTSTDCGREVQVFLDRHKGWRPKDSL